jgi:Family of unknown function (DUF5995)
MSHDVKTVPDVVARLKAIEADLSPDDGAAVFNHMYLAITGDVANGLDSAHVFRNPAFMAALDVTFAKFWLAAYDAPADALPKAWAPLFERRHDRSLLPIQFALAGMNAHIAHDLPVALVRTCRQLDLAPDDAAVHADYEKVNTLLAAKESEIRRSFLTDVGRRADKTVGPVVHLIDSWNIDKAREVGWVNAEALWAMRHMGGLADRYVAALARTVGMASRCLLTPVLAVTR